MIKRWFEEHKDGQGLVEYGLILVLVAVAVVATMSLLGQQVNEVFQDVSNTMNGGAITSVTAARTGNDNGNDVDITVTVSEPVTITATDSQSSKSASTSCSSTCTLSITGVGDLGGIITVSDGQGTRSARYNAKIS